MEDGADESRLVVAARDEAHPRALDEKLKIRGKLKLAHVDTSLSVESVRGTDVILRQRQPEHHAVLEGWKHKTEKRFSSRKNSKKEICNPYIK